MRRASHAVEAAGEATAALACAQRAEFDLLPADIVMPGFDGIEFAPLVTARQPWIRVVVITGFAAVAIADGDFGGNRPPVLAKPFHLRHLIGEIEALLAR
jgi:two-component system, cell cycle response regulator CpdR